MSSSTVNQNLQYLIQASKNPNSIQYNTMVDTSSPWISIQPTATAAAIASTQIPLPQVTKSYQDPLRQGYEWNPLRNKQVSGGDVMQERVDWKRKMSDPRHAWHAREALARNNIATNRMRLGPNTRVIECGGSSAAMPSIPLQ